LDQFKKPFNNYIDSISFKFS